MKSAEQGLFIFRGVVLSNKGYRVCSYLISVFPKCVGRDSLRRFTLCKLGTVIDTGISSVFRNRIPEIKKLTRSAV